MDGSFNQSDFDIANSRELPIMAGQDSHEDNADKSTMTMPVIQLRHKCKHCVRKSEKIKSLQRKVRRWKKFLKLKKKNIPGKKQVNTYLK